MKVYFVEVKDSNSTDCLRAASQKSESGFCILRITDVYQLTDGLYICTFNFSKLAIIIRILKFLLVSIKPVLSQLSTPIC